MFDWLMEPVNAILDFFGMLWDVVLFFVDGIATVINLLGSLPSQIQTMTNWLPLSLASGFMILVATIIAFRVVGRD